MNIALPTSESKTQLFINQAYTNYVQKSGFEPILITPQNSVEKIAKLCDGLLLPGGIDIDPIFYGEDNWNSGGADPEKDNWERSLLYAFTEEHKPVFGICRGFQLMMKEFIRLNPQFRTYFPYYQHIPSHSLAESLGVSRTQPTHSVTVSNMNHLYNTDLGMNDPTKKIMFVNSMHHQAIALKPSKKPGQDIKLNNIFNLIAFTSRGIEKGGDFVIEAAKIKMGSIWFGVQWHPEELMDTILLTNFLLAEKIKEQTTKLV